MKRNFLNVTLITLALAGLASTSAMAGGFRIGFGNIGAGGGLGVSLGNGQGVRLIRTTGGLGNNNMAGNQGANKATAHKSVAHGTAPHLNKVAVHIVEEKLIQVPAGATLTLQAHDLGATIGHVVLHLDKVSMPAVIKEWKADGVTATLPSLGLTAPVRAELILVKADGIVANTVKIELISALPQTHVETAGAVALTIVK